MTNSYNSLTALSYTQPLHRFWSLDSMPPYILYLPSLVRHIGVAQPGNRQNRYYDQSLPNRQPVACLVKVDNTI